MLSEKCVLAHLLGWGDLPIFTEGGLWLFYRWPKLNWWLKNVAKCQTNHLIQFQPQMCPQILSPSSAQGKSFLVFSVTGKGQVHAIFTSLQSTLRQSGVRNTALLYFSVIFLQFQFQVQFYHFKTVLKVWISNSTIKRVTSEIKCKKCKVV